MQHVDLHSHTYCSDGKLSPLELINLAVENNITDLAITDHDTVAAHRQLANVGDLGLNLIPGIELSAQWSKIGIHIVGLNIDINSDSIINILDVIETINIILNNNYDVMVDMDNNQQVNVLDVIQLINIILNN